MPVLPKEDGHIKIKVIGIGGCGGNALNNMIAHELRDMEFVFADTDAHAVDHSHAKTILQLDADLLRDDGTTHQHQDELLAERKRIRERLQDTDMVLIVACMGDAADIKLASIIAETAKDFGIFTLAVVSAPWSAEAQREMHVAEVGIAALSRVSDSVLMLPNQILTRETVNMESGIRDGLNDADHAAFLAVQTISDLLNHNYMHLDLTDMRAALCGAHQSIARMAYGAATGEGRALAAARRAISSPLMKDIDFHAAQGVLILVSGNSDMLLDEYDQAARCLQDMTKEDAIIICGMTCDEKMGEALSVAIMVADIERQAKDAAEGLQSLFMRMNSGGTVLSGEDRMNTLLKLNSESPKQTGGMKWQ